MPVEVLPSARERTARQNLAAAVARARAGLPALGPSLDFDAPVWVVPTEARAASAHRNVGLYFTTHEGGTSKDMTGRTPMSEPFCSLVKAILVLRHEARPKVPQNHLVMIRASRYLHDILADRGYDPALLVPDDFTTAAHTAAARIGPASVYRVGLFLQELADWMNRYNVSKVRIDYANPFARLVNTDTRFGKEADDRRARLMPGDDALDALARIANLVTDPADVVRMRCVELLVCGGWRINELLDLAVECEVWEPVFVNGKPMLGANGEPIQRYGISYFAEKGGAPGIKWIPTAMVDVARRAIADVRRLTEPARAVAAWNAANPGRAWLPDRWRGLPPNTEVTSTEIEQVFDIGNGVQQLDVWGIGERRHGRGHGRGSHVRVLTTLGRLEQALLERMPPIKSGTRRLLRHECLFLMPLNWAHQQRSVISAVVGLVQDQQISDFIVGRPGIVNLFGRYGFRDAANQPFAIRSHQFRHWLNTLAQQGGMSQMEIARWSGRKDMGQNAAYDHTSGVEMAKRAREMLAKGRVVGPVAEIHDRLPPVRREEFRRVQFATAHTTDLGMCANDWSLLPCMEHGSCADCSQHLVVKGDPDQRRRAQELLEEHEFLLAAARTEADDGTYGASNYVAHHRRMVDALEAVLAVHDDPTTEDSTLVQLDFGSGRAVVVRPDDEDTGAA